MTPSTRHVLCAVDYSAASRAALRSPALAGELAGARLTDLTVNNPLLVEAMRAYGTGERTVPEREELRRFCSEALGTEQPFDIEVRRGPGGRRDSHRCRGQQANLLVIGSHGLTGIRKMFFGSTAERVLRQAKIPVLVTPDGIHPVSGTPTVAPLIRRIVVPIDLMDGSVALVRVGAALGRAIGVPVLVSHAVEPLHFPARWQGRVPSLQFEARDRADAAIHKLIEDAGGEIEPSCSSATPQIPSSTLPRCARRTDPDGPATVGSRPRRRDCLSSPVPHARAGAGAAARRCRTVGVRALCCGARRCEGEWLMALPTAGIPYPRRRRPERRQHGAAAHGGARAT